MSACTREFLSHPIEDEKHSLIDHLLTVGEKTKEIFTQSKFSNVDLAFYSGLLHDIGKINPYYQQMFYTTKNNREHTKEKALEKYVGEHSRFSAWAIDKLLEKRGLDFSTIQKITVLIYGHHSRIRRTLGAINGEKFIATKNIISTELNSFRSQVSNISELSKLNWDLCLEEFNYPASFDVELESNNSPDDYLEMSYAFSCLLQADKGSFSTWRVPKFDLNLDTTLKKSNPSPLDEIRTNFQTQVIENFNDLDPISIINAPTGIGKTKAFLDIINKYSDNDDIQRVFYFSPLLALTEGFENAISKAIPKEKKKQYEEDILIYNHLFSDSLEKKNSNNKTRYSNSWIFEHESFNKKFIITTTQRLLMTIYSNKDQDKMKMASFRKSILIIDEVQTIPKPILSNLKEMFKKMNHYMGTKFILVSATIPHEINDIKRIELEKNTMDDYFSKTKKQISIQQFNAAKIPIQKTLVMANTRKKAISKYTEITQAYPNENVFYLSTGIRKDVRSKIIGNLSEKSGYVLVATQVVEAGVDIDFSHVFREQAPLDNIIQVMGRLNREGHNPDARLVIYPTDGKSIPYSPLEFKVTQEKIKKLKNSVDLYDILEDYYSEISEQNLGNRDDAKKLERLVKRMDFDEVWKFVRDLAIQEDDRDTVFIPDSENYESVRKTLLDDNIRKKFKAFGKFTASLPISIHKLKDKVGKNMFDEKLMEKNILLPQKQYLDVIYDKNMGLDKWLME